MKLPPLNALRAFECAARTGSFAAAGGELGVTPAAVSLQVRNLEDWLGRQLFTRRANRIWLTDAGRDYYMNAASALTDIASFTQALTESDPRRPLVISATPALGELWLPDRLARFAELRPDVPLELRFQAEDPDLEQHGIDARLSYGGELPEYRTTALFTDHLLPVGRPGSDPLQTRRIAVNWGQNISSVPGWAQWFAAQGVPPPETGPEVTAPSVPAALSLAAAGLGVALLPARVLSGALASGRVAACSGPSLPMPRPYVMITAHYKARSRRLRDLAGVLTAATDASAAT
ncbi:MAG: LysR substrate-binding domain-containing protein [Ruegeria sp.]